MSAAARGAAGYLYLIGKIGKRSKETHVAPIDRPRMNEFTNSERTRTAPTVSKPVRITVKKGKLRT